MPQSRRQSPPSTMSPPGSAATNGALQRSPTEKPPFTLGQIKKAVPPHCFERSVLKSFSYVVHDLVIAAGLLYFALVGIPALPDALQFAAWPLYWVAQGCVLAGVWVIAHGCGHRAFSDYVLLDDIVGLVLHSLLLVPYFSWKYSHPHQARAHIAELPSVAFADLTARRETSCRVITDVAAHQS